MRQKAAQEKDARPSTLQNGPENARWASVRLGRRHRAGLASTLTGGPHRYLHPQLEVIHAARERSSDPGFEPGLVVGHPAAAREPRAVEPLQGAEFEGEVAVEFDLGDGHGGKGVAADFAFG